MSIHGLVCWDLLKLVGGYEKDVPGGKGGDENSTRWYTPQNALLQAVEDAESLVRAVFSLLGHTFEK